MNQIKKEMMKIAEKLDPIDINHFIKCINNETNIEYINILIDKYNLSEKEINIIENFNYKVNFGM